MPIRFTGSGTDTVSTPDPSWQFSTALDIRLEVAVDNWLTFAQRLVAQWDPTGNQQSWIFGIDATGHLNMTLSTTGADSIINTSTATLDFAANTKHWVRLVYLADDGASNRVYKWYTSDDGVSWTQLGSTNTVSGTRVLFNSTAAVNLGKGTSGANSAFTLYSAEFRSSDGGTIVANPNPLNDARTPTTDTDSAGNVWTLGTGTFFVGPNPMPPFGPLYTRVPRGLNLPILGPPLFKNNNLFFGTIAQTLGSFTPNAYGQVAPQDIPQQLLTPRHPVPGLNLSIFSTKFFKNTNLIFGTSGQTLDGFTAASAGSVGRAALAQPAILLPYAPRGLQPPLLGKTFFAQPTISGSEAATLGAFTSSASGATGPSGTVDQTLGAFTSTATGATGPSGTVAVTLAVFTPAAAGGTGPSGTGAQTLAVFSPSISGGTGPSGTAAVTLGAFTADAEGTAEEPGADTTCFLALEDGTAILLEDGTHLLLEGCVEAAETPTAHGGKTDYTPSRETLDYWDSEAERLRILEDDEEVVLCLL